MSHVIPALMMLRTWALYGKSRVVGLTLLAFWLCTAVTVVGTVKSGLPVRPFPSIHARASNGLVLVCSCRGRIATNVNPTL